MSDPARDFWFSDEREVRDKHWSQIEPGHVVLDVGCHIGSYSIPALKAGATVYAVDPDVARLTCVRGYWDGDPDKLITIQKALAEPGGYAAEFRKNLDASAYSEFHAPADADFCTLDELADEYGLTRLDWVKIDVEGAELGVLSGAVKTLARLRPSLLIEAHDLVYKFVYDMRSEQRCHELLKDLGYEIEVTHYACSTPRDFWFCKAAPGPIATGS
jgi:FkbM family methyltransferase